MILIFIFAAILPALIKTPYWLDIFIFLFIYVILSTSLYLVFSTGQISFAHPGLAAIGAYGSGILALKAGVPFWITLPVGGSLAALASLVIGFPTLRLKGVYFFLISFMFTNLINVILGNFWIPIFGGYRGLLGVPRPGPISIPGLGKIGFESEGTYYYIVLLVVTITILVLYRLERSRFRLVFNAIRDADILAESVGINLMKYKLLCFVVGGFFAGVAGSLFAHYQRIITPYDFDMHSGILMIVYVVVGGMGTVFGPMIGTTILRLLGHPLRQFGMYETMLLGILLILILRFLPGGFISIPDRITSLWDRVRRMIIRAAI